MNAVQQAAGCDQFSQKVIIISQFVLSEHLSGQRGKIIQYFTRKTCQNFTSLYRTKTKDLNLFEDITVPNKLKVKFNKLKGD